jgi:iron complex outermembrane receptor protein
VPQFELNSDGGYNFDKPFVKPETLTDVEIGLGYRTNVFKGYANLFYMKFQDEIIKKGGLDRFGQPITGNADQTTHKGIELMTDVQVSPKISVSGNMMYSQNVLDSYSVYEGTKAISLDGNPIAGFPDILANLRLTFAWRNVYVSAILKYIGKQYTDNFKNDENTVDPYSTINISFRYSLKALNLEGLILQGRINNVLNKKYLTYGNGVEYFPAATRNGYLSLQYEF